jgi:hypothetical protein
MSQPHTPRWARVDCPSCGGKGYWRKHPERARGKPRKCRGCDGTGKAWVDLQAPPRRGSGIGFVVLMGLLAAVVCCVAPALIYIFSLGKAHWHWH